MHLVGFIIRIYHDARSPERQKLGEELCKVLSIEETVTKFFEESYQLTV